MVFINAYGFQGNEKRIKVRYTAVPSWTSLTHDQVGSINGLDE